MPNKFLLETDPLYKSMQTVLPVERGQWPRPSIVAPCDRCKSPQTYTMITDYLQYDQSNERPIYRGSESNCIKVVYECAGCHSSRRYFLILVTQETPRSTPRGMPPDDRTQATVQKVGQFPPYDIAPDPQLEKRLGKDRVAVFKKGLVCESHSYGIGAFAYYRRIIEQVIDELLTDIASLVPAGDQGAYAEALARARVSHRAVDKIEQVKDVLPASLQPSGTNPLLILHGALSEGIHVRSDEECLESAVAIRGALTFLVSQVRQSKESAAEFQKALQTLVQRQTERHQQEQSKVNTPNGRETD